MPIYSLLWADFVGPSASENTEHLEVIKMVLDNTLILLAARSVHAEDGNTHYSKPVSEADEEVLLYLEKL